MKLLKVLILFTGLIFIVSCLQKGAGQKVEAANPAGAVQKMGDVNSIPYPKEEWKGVQGKTLADSKPDFIGQKKAPDGAPNVLIVMLDDAGYSSATSYGGS